MLVNVKVTKTKTTFPPRCFPRAEIVADIAFNLMLYGLMSKRKTQTRSRKTPDEPHGGPTPTRRGRSGGPEHGRSERSGGGHGGQWLYGAHAVLAAIANPQRRCHRLIATHEAAGRFADALDSAGHVAVEIMARADIDRLFPAEAVHQGMAVLADSLPDVFLEDLLATASTNAPLVVLDQATDPRNIGAVLRSAAAFGAAGVIVQDRHAPEATAVMAKAASGALESVPFVRVTNIARCLDSLKSAGYWCVGLDADADGPLPDLDLPDRIALVLGSEGRGLRRLVAEGCDLLTAIPIAPGMESLNLSNAAAVTLYELARRRHARGTA